MKSNLFYIRNCPTCDKEIKYKSKDTLNKAIKKNTSCKSCNSKGENNPNYGKTSTLKGKKWEDIRTEENIKKGKERLKNGLFKDHKHSKDSKNKIGESVSGKNNGFYGKTHSEKTKNQIRKSVIRLYENGEAKNQNTKIELYFNAN